MFIGRTAELNALEKIYEKKGFGMTVIYGRRRIGKSALINEFVKDKKSIFYTATKVGKERNLELFSKQVLSTLEPEYVAATFPDLESVFDIITAKVNKEKIIIVIDELPYWAEKDESFLSIIQKYIDTKWTDKNLMLILCGSALSFMEKKILSEKSPLFGRRYHRFDHCFSAGMPTAINNTDIAASSNRPSCAKNNASNGSMPCAASPC